MKGWKSCATPRVLSENIEGDLRVHSWVPCLRSHQHGTRIGSLKLCLFGSSFDSVTVLDGPGGVFTEFVLGFQGPVGFS